MSRASTIIQKNTIHVGQQLLYLQGISPHLLFHLDLTYRGFTSFSLHLHLNPPRIIEIASLE